MSEICNNILETLRDLNAWSVTFRVILAVLLGGGIGLERGHHRRAAGLRTHILVCLGASVSALVGLYSVQILGFNSDPLRVGAQVVSGIGFLGVGTIMIKDREQVTGLTTAAGLWATASIGLAIGIGFYFAAFLAFLVVLITFSIFVYLERSVKNNIGYMFYMELSDANQLKAFLEKIRPYVSKVTVIPAKSGLSNHVGVDLTTPSYEHYQILLDMARTGNKIAFALPVD